MRLVPRKLDWYCVREMIGPFCTWMIALLILVEGNFLFLLLKAVQTKGIPLLQIVLFLAFKLPFSIVLAIPMAYLFACCLAIARLASEGETTAMQTSGVSPWRLLLPYIVTGWLASLFAFGINEVVAPWTNAISNQSVTQVMLSHAQLEPQANIKIQAGEFTFYAGGIDVRTNTMRDTVMLRTVSSPFPDIWLAEEADFDDQWVHMRDVTLISLDQDGRVERCGHAQKQTMDFREVKSYIQASRGGPDELSFRELRRRIIEQRKLGAVPRHEAYELNSKVAIPCASLVFVLLGAPLSLRFGRRGSIAGTVVALGLIFGYYMMLSWGKLLGLAGRIDPFWGAWAQNFLFAGIGLLLVWRAR